MAVAAEVVAMLGIGVVMVRWRSGGSGGGRCEVGNGDDGVDVT